MHILQSGQAKSGNYWLYTILQEIIKEAKIENRSFIKNDPIYPIAKKWELSTHNQVDENVMDITPNGCFYRISSIYRRPITNIKEYIEQNTHVWTHSSYNESSKTVFPLFDKIVYLIRDPRDVVLSMAKFSQTSYMKKYYPSPFNSVNSFIESNMRGMIKQWIKEVSRHLEVKKDHGFHVVYYERLLSDTEKELRDLLEYFDINLSGDKISSIVRKVSFDEMKKENPDHLNKAKLYGWQGKLSEDQNDQVVANASDLLQLLNYPLNKNEYSLPSFNKDFDLAGLQRKNAAKSLNLRGRFSLIKQALIS